MSNFVLDAISKVASAETALMRSTFVAPVAGNDAVAAYVMGMVYTFSIRPPEKPGWYLFKPSSVKRAEICGDADLPDVEAYLSRLPKVRVAIFRKVGNVYQGMPEKSNGAGLGHTVPVSVFLVDDLADDFDRVVCRHDGVNLWYDRVDPSNDPSKGDHLRKSFAKLSDPKSIRYKGLTFEEKAAYAMRFAMDKDAREKMKTASVRMDVEHAGGRFIGLKEKSDRYEVTYSVDGETYTSFVSKDPARTVISAGICLSGGDRAFDLKSLVTVMREGQRRRSIVRGHGGFGHAYDYENW